jgi:LacI family transcriptional regulator
MSAKVRIRDVAALAGVSVGTVSNVLNGVPSVKPRNLEQVQRAMAELGFAPNNHARQLRTGRGDAIGLVVLSVANPFFAEITHVAESVAEEFGATIIMGSSDQDPAREEHYIDLFEASRVRGLLIAPVDGVTPRLRELSRRGTPTVFLDDKLETDDFCSVALDSIAGGYLAASHLIGIGRRRLAVVGGPLGRIADRVSGANRAVEEAEGATLAFMETADLTVAEGRRMGLRIAAMPAGERPDAVFAGNDLIALGVLHELVLAGIGVPDEVALIGYDDIDFAETAIVPLSSIAQPRELIAREALGLLANEIGDAKHVHQRRLLRPELVVRASTAGRSDLSSRRRVRRRRLH